MDDGSRIVDTIHIAFALECPGQKMRVSACLSADEMRAHSLGLISPCTHNDRPFRMSSACAAVKAIKSFDTAARSATGHHGQLRGLHGSTQRMSLTRFARQLT